MYHSIFILILMLCQSHSLECLLILIVMHTMINHHSLAYNSPVAPHRLLFLPINHLRCHQSHSNHLKGLLSGQANLLPNNRPTNQLLYLKVSTGFLLLAHSISVYTGNQDSCGKRVLRRRGSAWHVHGVMITCLMSIVTTRITVKRIWAWLLSNVNRAVSEGKRTSIWHNLRCWRVMECMKGIRLRYIVPIYVWSGKNEVYHCNSATLLWRSSDSWALRLVGRLWNYILRQVYS